MTNPEKMISPGIYFTKNIALVNEEIASEKILKDFLESNDSNWLRYELNKIGLSVIMMEESNKELERIAHEDIIYATVFSHSPFFLNQGITGERAVSYP